MIHQAREKLTERGFAEEQQIEDNFGTVGYLLTFVGQRYVLVAKEFAYQGNASFLGLLVSEVSSDTEFIFYCATDDTFTVFDAEYVAVEGEDSAGKSKKRHATWKEVPMSAGARLDDYIRGEDRPETLAGENRQLEAF